MACAVLLCLNKVETVMTDENTEKPTALDVFKNNGIELRGKHNDQL